LPAYMPAVYPIIHFQGQLHLSRFHGKEALKGERTSLLFRRKSKDFW
jgi:hypothetical protein